MRTQNLTMIADFFRLTAYSGLLVVYASYLYVVIRNALS